MEQSRYRQIYREKALMNGGYTIGGGQCCKGGAPRGYKCTCEKQKMYPPKGKYKKSFVRCSKYACSKKGAGYAVGGSRTRGMRSGNPWINFVHQVANSKGISYAEALADPATARAYHR
jgi:hypothetical protein